MTGSSMIMQRIVAGITLGIAFIVMASVFVPTDSSAVDHTAGSGHAVLEHLTGSLGVIEDDEYLVTIDATEHGPRYSVYRSSDGEPLDELLTAEEIGELYPDLPITGMSAEAGTALMMVDPNDPNMGRLQD